MKDCNYRKTITQLATDAVERGASSPVEGSYYLTALDVKGPLVIRKMDMFTRASDKQHATRMTTFEDAVAVLEYMKLEGHPILHNPRGLEVLDSIEMRMQEGK